MSTGPGEGSGVPAPGPVPPARTLVLSRLAAERRQAEGCRETGRVAEIDAQIARLSAGTTENPARETTGRRPARNPRRAA